MNKISIFIPVAPWDLLPAQLLLKSLIKYFDPDSLDTVFIAYPDKKMLNDYLKLLNPKFQYSVINEKDVIPEKDYPLFKRRKGWFRQQIVKMYISKRIKTEFYLCLDSDLLCIKPTSYNDLIKNGRPGINYESKDVHANWWKQSQKVLNLPDSSFHTGMSSSTNILITSEVIDLISYVENLYLKSFTRVLLNWFWINSYFFRRHWTEYKLYWLFIEYKKKTGRYDPSNKIWGKSIWKITEHVTDELFKEILSFNNDGYFIIWQSPKVSYEQIRDKAAEYLGI